MNPMDVASFEDSSESATESKNQGTVWAVSIEEGGQIAEEPGRLTEIK